MPTLQGASGRGKRSYNGATYRDWPALWVSFKLQRLPSRPKRPLPSHLIQTLWHRDTRRRIIIIIRVIQACDVAKDHRGLCNYSIPSVTKLENDLVDVGIKRPRSFVKKLESCTLVGRVVRTSQCKPDLLLFEDLDTHTTISFPEA